MRFGLSVTGGDAAAEKFRAIAAVAGDKQGGTDARNAVFRALLNSAAVIQQAVKAAAPVGTEPTRKTRRIWSTPIGRGRFRRKLRLSAPMSVSFDYGHLRDNVRRGRANRRRSNEIAVVVGRGRAFWAYFLERGTRRMRPHPFWRLAAQSAEPQARAEFERAFRAAVDAAARRRL